MDTIYVTNRTFVYISKREQISHISPRKNTHFQGNAHFLRFRCEAPDFGLRSDIAVTRKGDFRRERASLRWEKTGWLAKAETCARFEAGKLSFLTGKTQLVTGKRKFQAGNLRPCRLCPETCSEKRMLRIYMICLYINYKLTKLSENEECRNRFYKKYGYWPCLLDMRLFYYR